MKHPDTRPITADLTQLGALANAITEQTKTIGEGFTQINGQLTGINNPESETCMAVLTKQIAAFAQSIGNMLQLLEERLPKLPAPPSE